MTQKNNQKIFIDKLLVIYPNLSEEEAIVIIKQLYTFWENMIENIDKIK